MEVWEFFLKFDCRKYCRYLQTKAALEGFKQIENMTLQEEKRDSMWLDIGIWCLTWNAALE